ncbi:capsule biosynthesis protein [Methylobacterium planeticum]|uniref:Capsule biosynthesis protein n=1 Tax=Methylobacterium planeticum TaxID=2615211 RepID=A0A6N6MUD5_9HYPH|nr:capsule biosynthesis protein [Methylobacterium planeticum]KAB1075104.1 capsule biosynthesis protein [Methylobacterium planeticum]
MTVEIRNPQGQPLTTADRSAAVADSLRQIARLSRFADRKKGIRSYPSHVKSDPWVPLLFLLCFVLPTLVGAVYYGLIASDRYVTEARFALRPAIGSVEKASPDSVGTNSGVPHSMVAQDTLITYNYILSRPMVEAVSAELPLREMFTRPETDFLSRFNPDKPIEKFLKYWRNRVDVEIEQGSGIMTLTVNAFDPAESLAITQAVLRESERMVNALSTAARNDALAESNRELKLAEERLTAIRVATRDLRNREGVLDAQKTNDANLKVISELRTARINLSVQLTLSQRDLGPESRRILDLKTQIKDLDDNIARIERQSASQDPEQKRLLSDALTRFETLENERKDAEKYYAKVLAASERARIIAARQIEFFSLVVQPVQAQSAQQPRALLMISLIAAGAAVLFAGALFARKQMS